jgi:hypothetical protein
MRSVSHIAGIVLGLSLMTCAVWAQQTIGGNPVVKRSYVDTGNLFVMDTNQPFKHSGAVTQWEIYADNTNPVQLVIYRQSNGSFVEVGRSQVVTPALGYNWFQLTSAIPVRAGDFVGAYFPGSTGPISFSVDAGALGELADCSFEPALAYSAVFAFSGSSTDFVCSQNRHYSLRAY